MIFGFWLVMEKGSQWCEPYFFSIHLQQNIVNCPNESIFDITICDRKISSSPFVSWNIKSSGKRSMLRFTCSFSLPVFTPYIFVSLHKSRPLPRDSKCLNCRAKYTILGYYAYKREKFREFLAHLVNCSYLCGIKIKSHKTMQIPTIDSKCWAAFLEMGARLVNSPSKY